jgi:hypothetical protein
LLTIFSTKYVKKRRQPESACLSCQGWDYTSPGASTTAFTSGLPAAGFAQFLSVQRFFL